MPNLLIQHAIDTYVQGAREHAESCGVVLDASEASIVKVEEILAFMHQLTQQGTATPSEQQFTDFANGYGAYIGEIVRQKFGGEWLIFKDESSPFHDATALRTRGIYIFPPVRVYWRLTQGAENNVVEYYQSIQQKLELGSQGES